MPLKTLVADPGTSSPGPDPADATPVPVFKAKSGCLKPTPLPLPPLSLAVQHPPDVATPPSKTQSGRLMSLGSPPKPVKTNAGRQETHEGFAAAELSSATSASGNTGKKTPEPASRDKGKMTDKPAETSSTPSFLSQMHEVIDNGFASAIELAVNARNAHYEKLLQERDAKDQLEMEHIRGANDGEDWKARALKAERVLAKVKAMAKGKGTSSC